MSHTKSDTMPDTGIRAADKDTIVPNCSIDHESNDILVTFPQEPMTYLAANSLERSSMVSLAIDKGAIPPGTYEVVLESFDNHDGSIPDPGSIHDQKHEQWQAQLMNGDDGVVAQTNMIDDIPNESQLITQQVNNNLFLTQSVTKVIAKHAYYPADNPQSHYPICAVFRPADDTFPSNDCGKPKDFSISPACELTTSVGSATIDWAKVDAAINGYEYQLSLATNFKAKNRIDTDFIDQPLGSVRPSTSITYTHPPTLHFRARSKCVDNKVSKWSPWQTITFEPDFCGGPSPTPSPVPVYDVTVNLRQTDDVCTESKPLLTGSFSGRVRANPLDPVASNIDYTTSAATFTFENLQGEFVVRPFYADFQTTDDTPAWTRAIGPFCQAQQSVSQASELNFYFTSVKGPWWQSSFGDIFGDSVVSKIPSTASDTFLSLGEGASDPGVVLSHANLELGTGLPSHTNYHAHNQQIPVLEDVAYFKGKLQGLLSPLGDITSISTTGLYQATGHQTLSTPLHITGNKKIIVVIDGPQAQLTINQPIQVDPDAFILFVVDGPITFASSVNQVRGIFLASGDITILSSNQAFTGYGSFISTGGDIISHRSLPGSDNNTMPATKFVYDPRLVINTPKALRTTSTAWQEIAP